MWIAEPNYNLNMKSRIFSFLSLALLTVRLADAAPIVTSFQPNFGSSTDLSPINIYGSGFFPGTLNVKFNGTVASFANVTDTFGTNIQAFIASGTKLGPGQIQVTIGSQSTSNSALFYVIGQGPFITNFVPTIGQAGTPVVITGVHFSSATSVTFNGINQPTFHVASDNEIDLNAPSGVSTGPIIVTTSQGSFSSITNVVTGATNFFVRAFIKGFSPVVGRSGTNVMISGSNFLYATSVKFNGISASFTAPANNTNIFAVVPPNATTGPISVDNPVNNPFTTSSNFVIQPTVSGFSPGFGPVGTSVTVMGANFNVGTPTVKFGGATAATPTGVSFGQLTAVVPSGASNAPITVITTDGSNTSSQIFYLPASITSFSPTNAPTGATVRVNGQNFLGATTVTFTGAFPVTPNVTNNTILGVVVPAGVITGPISVTTPAGTASSGGLLFYGSPSIFSFNPGSGLPGTNVTIIGTNFLGSTGVKFNGVSASSFTVVNNGQINTMVPVGASTGPISVLAPGGTNASAIPFVVNATDVSVTLGDNPDPVFVGSNLVYTIILANNGGVPATSVKLTNNLPASVALIGATTTLGSLNTNANPILGTIGTIGIGGSATVTLTVVPQVPGTIVNTASAGSDLPDSNLLNNTNSASTTVWPLPILSIALLTNQVQVAWPMGLSNFTLQFIPALATNTFWSNSTLTPTISGTNLTVLDDSTNPSKFYRLKQ